MLLKKLVFSLLLFILFFAACDDGRIYEESLKIPEAKWERDQTAKFEFEIEDSLANYAFFLHFRHAGDYPYKNIYLFTRTQSPTGKLALDTAQMILANNQGKWLGKGIGDIYDYQFKFKQGPIFQEKGKYQVEIEQAMREKTLSNVTDIGIGIKKITP